MEGGGTQGIAVAVFAQPTRVGKAEKQGHAIKVVRSACVRPRTWFLSVMTRSIAAAGFAIGLLCHPLKAADAGWLPFDPGASALDSNSPINLRRLNEAQAGDHGPIQTKDGRFIRSGDGSPIRFWAVNGPPSAADSPEKLAGVARALASYGVNLVRIHGAVFDKDGRVDPKRVRHIRECVTAMKSEGIYTLLSIYFPLWFDPAPGTDWLPGYDGRSHAFATLLFNPAFQQRYRSWWEAILESRDAAGVRLADEAAVMGLEVQNEDSFFFWTFSERNLPGPQLEILERQFADWAAARHGSITGALEAWGRQSLPRDNPGARRLGFRPLWNIANERTSRDRGTAAFLFETQARFYRESVAFLRRRGFKGVITASNWTTADARVLGPLEKMSYLEGDFMDRHGYFAGSAKGDASEWSIREGHTFSHRSALRFDPDKPGGPRSFNHPVMDPEYNGYPSMISETTWTRPNRHRGEAPLFLAAYGALQDSDAIVHFALDGAGWSVKPNYFMQPWTLMAPTQMGQFPATALIFRENRVRAGEILADVQLRREDVLALKGTPLPQDAAFDELRLKDVPDGTAPLGPNQRIDPLLHFAGRARVTFGTNAGTRLRPLAGLVDHAARRIRSSTGELELDYGLGLLELRAASAQGASGNLAARGPVELPELRIESPLDVLTVLLVSLDAKPLRESSRMLLQVMTEESPTGWATEAAGPGLERIARIGTDPWRFHAIRGSVTFRAPDASRFRITPLDLLGRPGKTLTSSPRLVLEPGTVYYEITR